MSLPRPRASRSKSRSPAPPPTSLNGVGQSSPRFFPPSYYAAANGLPYPAEKEHVSSSDQHLVNYQNVIPRSITPSTYQRGQLSSESSSEEVKLPIRARPSSAAGKLPVRSPNKKNESPSKRKSQLENLEAQLLPSLRDTIGRMTHPTSPAQPLPAIPSLSSASTSTSGMRKDISASFLASPRPAPSPRFPAPPIHSPMGMQSPQASGSSTPKARPRSILKSTPNLRAAAGFSPSISHSPLAPSRPSKMERDGGTGSHTNPLSSKGPSTPKLPTLATPRSRSHSGPSTGPSNPAAAPYRFPPVASPSLPPLTPSTPRTGLPRRTIPVPPSSYSSKVPVDDSSSEYEDKIRDKRVLVVTNALVAPSSSSESEGDGFPASKRRAGSKLPRFAASGRDPRRDGQSASAGKKEQNPNCIGLGLGIGVDVCMGKEDQVRELNEMKRAPAKRVTIREEVDVATWTAESATESEYAQGEDDASVYEDDEAEDGERDAGVHGDTIQSPAEEIHTDDEMIRRGEELVGASESEEAWSATEDFDTSVPSGWSAKDPHGTKGGATRLSSHPAAKEASYRTGAAERAAGEHSTRFSTPDERGRRRSTASPVPASFDPSVTPRKDRTKDKRGRPISMPLTAPSPTAASSPPPLPSQGPAGSLRRLTGNWNAYAGVVERREKEGLYSAKHQDSLYENGEVDVSDGHKRQHEVIPNINVKSKNSGARDEEQILAHADSDMSFVEAGDRWRSQSEDFSVGAESMFSQLRIQGPDKGTRGDKGGDNFRETIVLSDDLYSHEAISQSLSAPSVYEDDSAQGAIGDEVGVSPLNIPTEGSVGNLKSWRSNMPPSAYQSLLKRYGETEMQRQEIIWELFETEHAFVKQLRSVVGIFIQPLRAESSRRWLQGVPSDIGRLFDWFEDIFNLHSQIYSTLHNIRSSQWPVVEKIAEVLRGFVPRLEVYQPYLVRLNEVAKWIGHMVQDESSDFGEYIRIKNENAFQEGSPFNLERLLVEPIKRLALYPEFFRRLWELTPRSHLDHLPTFSLLHSTEMIIRVMNEVKVREDEYDLVKDICSRIDGLPPAVVLASRERRLLTQGLLFRLHLSENFQPSDAGYDSGDYMLGSAGQADPRSSSWALESSTQARKINSRQSRLESAIQEWGVRRSRAGSFDSNASSSPSFRSHDSSSSTDSTPVDGSSGDSPLKRRRRPASFLSLQANEQTKQSPVYAFVMTDLVLLTTLSLHNRQRGGHERWRLLEDVGIARILGVTEHRAGTDRLVSLELLPMDIDQLQTGVISEDASVVAITLSQESRQHSERRTDEDEWSRWIDAFRACYKHTLRSLSFPSHSGKYLAHGPSVDLEFDTRQTVMSILSSGLPLPKSPSMLIDEVRLGGMHDAVIQEREERGWWALRFQQVLKEMQRADPPLSLPRDSLVRQGSTPGSRRRTAAPGTRPLRLLDTATIETPESKRTDGRYR